MSALTAIVAEHNWTRTRAALEAMFALAPMHWWRFVPCATCNALRQEPCKQGGASWPALAYRPHGTRVAAARVLHGTLWLIANGFEDDVFDETTSPERAEQEDR